MRSDSAIPSRRCRSAGPAKSSSWGWLTRRSSRPAAQAAERSGARRHLLVTGGEIPMSKNRTPSLAHVVYRTRRFEQMLAWYKEVFGAKVQHQNPVMAFLTYDN